MARASGLAGGFGARPAYALAQRETLAAIAAEQRVFRSGEAVTFDRYLSVSHGKQRVGLPASLALARVAGWDARRTRALARLLDAVALGLQLHDDVLDWEDDLARGGAWATLLAAGASPRRGATVPVSPRRLVHGSGRPRPHAPGLGPALPRRGPSGRGPGRSPPGALGARA